MYLRNLQYIEKQRYIFRIMKYMVKKAKVGSTARVAITDPVVLSESM